jgi:hypothetical protein
MREHGRPVVVSGYTRIQGGTTKRKEKNKK